MTIERQTRRETPLLGELVERIRRDGPITVREYMTACMHDPAYGYYRMGGVIGQDGDFITSPEISQIFGELIGLWTAVVWRQMGSPDRFNLVELGPGRGSLMRDALRAMQIVPECAAAVRVHLVEVSETLANRQRVVLTGSPARIIWHTGLGSVPVAPTILLANEFLDALPVYQFVRTERGWRERTVGLDSRGQLEFGHAVTHSGWPIGTRVQKVAQGLLPQPMIGDILEAGFHERQFNELSNFRGAGLVALFIDYGHDRTKVGDTLQAVRKHRYEDPLCAPGEADLSAQVDFENFADNMRHRGWVFQGPLSQLNFLTRLGIRERAERLILNATSPRDVHLIESGVERLTAAPGMGTRFKAVVVRSQHLPPVPPFD